MIKLNEKGLVPAIAQDAQSGEVLMLGYMDEEALKRTLSSGQAWFYSRSRSELWHKGATSGSYLNLRSILIDCDEDTILLKVEPTGPVCHTGNKSCFFQELSEDKLQFDTTAIEVINELFDVIRERQINRPEGSYVASLFEEGLDKIGKKVIEEAGEVVIAAKNGQGEQTVSEVADLWFHSMVLLAASGLRLEDVWAELRRRRK
ncbi:MAG: bifunctional phosphoribosyl-AMP cyclohydrolase/phosphoribosyl-ATP diphosphatase HisIE [Dehalococcoidia bacterium]